MEASPCGWSFIVAPTTLATLWKRPSSMSQSVCRTRRCTGFKPSSMCGNRAVEDDVAGIFEKPVAVALGKRGLLVLDLLAFLALELGRCDLRVARRIGGGAVRGRFQSGRWRGGAVSKESSDCSLAIGFFGRSSAGLFWRLGIESLV